MRQRSPRQATLLITAVFAVGTAACARDDTSGSNGATCHRDGTCEGGLRCASGICVPAADGSPPDAAIPDAAIPDAAIPDAAIPDAAPAPPDAAVPDAMPPDAAAASCDPVVQTGCAAGEKCGFVLSDADTGAGRAACVADGNLPRGASCTSPLGRGQSDDCVAGAWCFAGKCIGMCSEGRGCGDDEVCVGVTGVEGFGACVPGCDPLDQAGTCGGGQGCYPVNGGAVCVASGGIGVGEPCESINACAPGSTCFGPPGEAACRSLCADYNACLIGDGDGIEACGDCNGKLSTPCGTDQACFPISNGAGGRAHPSVGACVPATDAGCSCTDAPGICPFPI